MKDNASGERGAIGTTAGSAKANELAKLAQGRRDAQGTTAHRKEVRRWCIRLAACEEKESEATKRNKKKGWRAIPERTLNHVLNLGGIITRYRAPAVRGGIIESQICTPATTMLVTQLQYAGLAVRIEPLQ